MSRELAILLHIDYWESDSYFPRCSYKDNNSITPQDKTISDDLLWMTQFNSDSLFDPRGEKGT